MIHAMLNTFFPIAFASSMSERGGDIVISTEKDILYRQHDGNVIGAIRVTKGFPYVLSKVLSLRSVWKRNRRNYMQAKDIIKCGALSFMYNRIKYLLRR